MRTLSILRVLALFTLVASVAMAADGWVSFAAGQDRSPALRVSGAPEQFTVDVTVPGIELGKQEGYVTVRLPGHALSMVAGNPELPVLSTSVLLPDRGTPKVRVEALSKTTIKLNGKVIPSRGSLKRNVDPQSVPLVQGPVYKKNEFYPAGFEAKTSSPFILRDFRGASIRINPVSYNPVTNELVVLKKARLHVQVVQGLVPINEKHRTSNDIDRDFSSIYRRLFVNFDQGSSFLKGQPNENVGRALVLCPDKWVKNLEPLMAWRAVKGLESKLVKTSEVAGGAAVTADQIKAFIKSEYDKGGLTFVLLVGDSDTMPTLKGENEKADSDACLVKLEGDDHVPDCFISRFSAMTDADVDVQVNRALAYEKTPVTGDAAGFYKKAVGIASAEGSPTDYARCELLREALQAFRYTAVDKIYDPGASKTKVAEAVNEGRGLINYIGHGSKTAWVTTRFGVSDAKALTNGAGKWPMIWSVACVNGQFAGPSDCFAEAWAKAGTPADPTGAIGMVAASTNMAWVPPCDWQNAIVTQYVCKDAAFTGGALHYLGLLKAMEQWGTDAQSDGVQLVEQCIYFGDCSVVLRNDIPAQAKVEFQAARGKAVAAKVTAGDKPVKFARVVVVNGADPAVVGVTGEDGLVTLTLGNGGSKNVTVTVTGPNLIPIVQQEMALP